MSREQPACQHSGIATMSTSLHSEMNLVRPSKLSAAQARALAAQKLPIALTLAAIILSILGIRP